MYHLTSRGNGGGAIYLDNEDRELFLSVLATVVARFNWRLYAYCLMSNHYHLLVETPQPNLSRGMRQLNGVYTQRFNRRHAISGHVFQGRFKAILVERDNYLLELARYVVLNPIRSKQTEDLASYVWSSYRATAGLQPIPNWLSADFVLNRFGLTKSSARRRYIEYVQAGTKLPTIWENLKQQIYLGSDGFVESVQKRAPNLEKLAELPRAQKYPPPKPLEVYANAHKDISEAIKAAYRSGHYTLAAIGRYFGVHYSTVSRMVKAAEQKP